MEPDELAGEDLVDEVNQTQASNRQRLAGLEAKLGHRVMPDFTVGLVDLLADATLGIGTVRRWNFTLEWERQIADWLDAQEAEVRKAEMLAAISDEGPLTATEPAPNLSGPRLVG